MWQMFIMVFSEKSKSKLNFIVGKLILKKTPREMGKVIFQPYAFM